MPWFCRCRDCDFFRVEIGGELEEGSTAAGAGTCDNRSGFGFTLPNKNDI
jgi:hypothetical protein